MRLIDADALKRAIATIMPSRVEVNLVVDDQPDAIIRFKDCKHSEPWYGDKNRCFLWHETGIDVFNDGFCNYGERKD